MDGTTDPAQRKGKGKPRIAEPQRRQGVIRFEMPEDMLEPTHPARVLWNVVGTLDLSAFRPTWARPVLVPRRRGPCSSHVGAVRARPTWARSALVPRGRGPCSSQLPRHY
jgi:hypothetical protein